MRKRSEQENRSHGLRHKLQNVAAVLFLMILLVNVWLLGCRLILKQDLPKVFGYGHAIVLSGSMEPVFSPGDLLIYREEDFYEPGDVIIFRHDGALVTHRIIGLDGEKFVTRGDANNTADQDHVAPSEVEGRMVGILRGVGNLFLFFRSPLGILLLIGGGLLLYELPG